ncbi:MAG: glycosyltransferase [Planctomycetes bacterium]|nr:glycosyltransferase [Planctomycetota bacterium]
MAVVDLAVIIPTRDRVALLQATLDRLGLVSIAGLSTEVYIVDNGSSEPVGDSIPMHRLSNGWTVSVLRNDANLGAAGRNVACARTDARWALMLDDDSVVPADAADSVGALIRSLDGRPDVFAAGGRITLPDGRHEAGGVPEVFVGCGALVRVDVFNRLGGYDGAFQYYAEEYDLCARAIASGYRIVHDARLPVVHLKAGLNRDMNRILRLLVRNNGWVTARYAPTSLIDDELARVVERYGQIAVKEGAEKGFEEGVDELRATVGQQKRTPLTLEQYERFRGTAAVRAWLGNEVKRAGVTRVQLVGQGKGVDVVVRVLNACGVTVETGDSEADACDCAVIGTISPGPMEDAAAEYEDQFRVVLRPWEGL